MANTSSLINTLSLLNRRLIKSKMMDMFATLFQTSSSKLVPVKNFVI